MQALSEKKIVVHHCQSLDQVEHLEHHQCSKSIDCVSDEDMCEAIKPVLIVALSSSCQPAFDRRVQQWCKERKLALVRIGIWQHEAVIGPFVTADEPGCVVCAEMRRIRALVSMAKNELQFLAWCDEHEDQVHARPQNPWLTRAACQVISLTAASDISVFVQSGTPGMGLRTVRFLRLRSLTNSCHSFLPDPLCDVCATQQDDCAEDAIIRFQPRLRADYRQYHLRPVAQQLERLEERYVDHRLGLQFIPATGIHSTAAVFATTVSHYYEYPYVRQQVTGSGLAQSFRSSHTIAILEALERYCSFLPRRKRSVVYGSYQALHGQAINPEQFGLYTEEQLQSISQERPGSHHVRSYSPDMPFYWVWGYSLMRQQPVLIPEQIAYYGAQTMRPEHEQFMVETSNGCAVGSSLEEAVMHGLCEVIERDAFFLTWYARLRVPALDWRSTRDTDLLLAFERSMRMTGFDFYAFDCTMDLTVPVILVLAVNRKNQAPRVLLGAAAHLDPDKALGTAFYEAASDIIGQNERFPQDLKHGKHLLEDSSLIRNIEDHVLAGSMPEAFSRFQFLLEEQPLQSMQTRFATQYARQPSLDLTIELAGITTEVIQRGYDVIIVDQTSPELQADGFAGVRVLVPGFVPLTIGHRFRRTHNLPRLYHLPCELGYIDHILSEADLNPDPHAFP